MKQAFPEEGTVLLQKGSFQTELNTQGPPQRFQLNGIHLSGTGLNLSDHALHRVGRKHPRNKKDKGNTNPYRQNTCQDTKEKIFAKFHSCTLSFGGRRIKRGGMSSNGDTCPGHSFSIDIPIESYSSVNPSRCFCYFLAPTGETSVVIYLKQLHHHHGPL